MKWNVPIVKLPTHPLSTMQCYVRDLYIVLYVCMKLWSITNKIMFKPTSEGPHGHEKEENVWKIMVHVWSDPVTSEVHIPVIVKSFEYVIDLELDYNHHLKVPVLWTSGNLFFVHTPSLSVVMDVDCYSILDVYIN